MKQFNGFLNIYKEQNYTSHDVVAIVKKILNQKKAGHTGTLDPMASGVLPVCLGRSTKLSDYIMSEKKGYNAQVVLGVETDTQDSSGTVLKKRPVMFQEEKIRMAVNRFTGEQTQIPPMYSAIKVNGRKLYEMARKGIEVERKPRHITIYDLKLKSLIPPDRLEIEIVCSKGTYIRTLCADIGEALGCGAHMAALTRTFTGSFTLADSITTDRLKELAARSQVEDVLIPPDAVFGHLQKAYVKKEFDKFLKNGNHLPFHALFQCGDIRQDEKILLYDFENCFAGIYKKDQNKIKPIKILCM